MFKTIWAAPLPTTKLGNAREKGYCFWNFHPFGMKWSYKESSKHVILYLNCKQARSGYHLFGGEYCCLCLNKFQEVLNFLPTYFLFIGSCLDQRERPWKDQDKPGKKSTFRIIRALSHLVTSFKTPHHLLHAHPNWELGVPVSKLVHLARFWLSFQFRTSRSLILLWIANTYIDLNDIGIIVEFDESLQNSKWLSVPQ